MSEKTSPTSATSVEKPVCDHEGHYRSAGLFPVEMGDSMTILTIIYCKKCGWVGFKPIKIIGLAAPKPIIPNFSMPRRGN